MGILWTAIVIYVGLVYLVCWLLILSKVFSGGWSWKDLVISGIFAPLYVSFAVVVLVIATPRKAWRALKGEIELRKKEKNQNGS